MSIKMKKIEKLLEKEFKDIKIEDTNIPLKIVATDIKKWISYIFTSWK